MTIIIHHNPACGTSRNTLEMIRDSGEEPVIVEYLETGWTKPYLQSLFAIADITPKEALRISKSPAEELGLTRPDITDEELLNAMVTHPVLVNRPFVCSPKGVRLCRPSEKVLELLEGPTQDSFTTEDGKTVSTNS